MRIKVITWDRHENIRNVDSVEIEKAERQGYLFHKDGEMYINYSIKPKKKKKKIRNSK